MEYLEMSTVDQLDTERGWASPIHIANHPILPLAEKRSLLASWASDMRAVPNHPSLRRLDDGRLVQIDDVLDALRRLDGTEPTPWTRRPPETRSMRRGRWSRLSRRWRRWSDDDDDDPPPGVAAEIRRWPTPKEGLTEAQAA